MKRVTKPLAVIFLMVFLTGCVDAYLPRPYDANEFDRWVRLLVKTAELRGLCEEDAEFAYSVIPVELYELHKEATTAEVYARFTPRNEEVATAAKIVVNDFQEMRDFYAKGEHNEIYCKAKTELVGKKIKAMVEVIPTRRR